MMRVYLNLESKFKDELYIDNALATPLPLPPLIHYDDESKERKHTIKNLSSINIVEVTNILVRKLTLTLIIPTSIRKIIIKRTPNLDGYS